MRSDSSRRLRLPTPPLWLFALFEAVQALLATVLLIAVPVAVVEAIRSFTGFELESAASLAGQLWLVMHAAPLELNGGGVFHLVPLGLLVVPFGIAWRAGRRLAQGAYPTQLWVGVTVYVVLYTTAAGAVGGYAHTSFAETSPTWSATAAAAVTLTGCLGGCVAEARSVTRMFGVDVEAKLDELSQPIKWAGAYLWAVVRAGTVAAVAAVGLASLLLAGVLAWRWMDVVNAYQHLDTGLAGGLGMTLLHLAVAPNLALWALAYSSGAGFSLGSGSTVGPLTTRLGEIPEVPVLAAVPTSTGEYSWLVFALPVAAGIAAGVWFLREGENHFDDWCALKLKVRGVSATVSTLTVGLLTGLTTAGLLVVPLWLSHISLGVGRMVDIGPHALAAAGLTGAWVAAGCALTQLVAPLTRYRGSKK
ncbi:DUF6350 family protein [Nesterenkonia alba]|uniref:cell division protein PerM n=1 Tax=Nesterenkonia alba TaxID=515814 RepID=UPI0003B5DD33|nr:DUF6350 family protein [Nesterenkonia alba]